jgi:predicted ester cyclase
MGASDGNAATTRRYYDALWNDRDRTVIPEWIASEYVGHFTRYPEPVLGVAGFEAMADELFRAFPDLRVQIEDLVADGDRVASRVRIVGTHRGVLQGYAPTGVRVDTIFAAIERYRDDRCVEEWVFSDDLGIARQIKALPTAGGVGERIAQALHRLSAPLIRRTNR